MDMNNEKFAFLDKWFDNRCIFEPKDMDGEKINKMMFGSGTDFPFVFLVYMVPTVAWCIFASIFFHSWTVLVMSFILRIGIWLLWNKFNVMKYSVPITSFLGIFFFSSVFGRVLSTKDSLWALSIMVGIVVLIVGYCQLMVARCYPKQNESGIKKNKRGR